MYKGLSIKIPCNYNFDASFNIEKEILDKFYKDGYSEMKKTITTVKNENTAVTSDEESGAENVGEHAEMSLEALIDQMNQYSESDNIFYISKKAEKNRAIFYQKLKQITKEDTVKDIEGPEEEKKKSTLHPLEVEFRKAYNKLKIEKAKAKI